MSRITAESGVPAAAHLTCVGASREEVNAVVRGYEAAGVKRIVALRGDPPEGIGATFTPHPEGYRSGAELVAGSGPSGISTSRSPPIPKSTRRARTGRRRSIT